MKGRTGPVFGSTLRILTAAALPAPNRACRVIPGTVWIKQLLPDWREHLAQAIIGMHYQVPRLAASTSPVVWFTDHESLEGLADPAQLARRLSFPLPDHNDCTRYGCVIIEFRIPDHSLVKIPAPAPGLTVGGITHSGAREWVYNRQIELTAQTNIIYVDPNGPMHYYIPLD
jgi:hypothetical protein